MQGVELNTRRFRFDKLPFFLSKWQWGAFCRFDEPGVRSRGFFFPKESGDLLSDFLDVERHYKSMEVVGVFRGDDGIGSQGEFHQRRLQGSLMVPTMRPK